MTPACPICHCQAHGGERQGVSAPLIHQADLVYTNSPSLANPLQFYTIDIHYPFQRSYSKVCMAFTWLKRLALTEKTLKYCCPTMLHVWEHILTIVGPFRRISTRQHLLPIDRTTGISDCYLQHGGVIRDCRRAAQIRDHPYSSGRYGHGKMKFDRLRLQCSTTRAQN